MGGGDLVALPTGRRRFTRPPKPSSLDLESGKYFFRDQTFRAKISSKIQMRMTRIALTSAFMLTALPQGLLAQSYEIRGTVTDASTGQPLAEVTVEIFEGNGIPPPEEERTIYTTGDRGSFVHVPEGPGQYVIRVRREGYAPASGRFGAQQSARISDATPTATVSFSLEASAMVTGRIIDKETQEPIEGMSLMVGALEGINGYLRALALGGGAVTDANGEFRQETSAGQYLIGVARKNGPIEALAEFTEEDVDAVDLGYREGYYPGGPDIETALPVTVLPGSIANVGTIELEKEELYRVLLDIDPASCLSDQIGILEEAPRFGSIRILGSIACGPVLITGLSPGDYEFMVQSSTEETRRGISVPVSVTNANMRVPVTLPPGVTITGRFVSDDVDLEQIGVTDFDLQLSGSGWAVLDAKVPPLTIEKDGRWRYENVIGTGQEWRVDVTNLPEPYYIKQVRYQNAVAPNRYLLYTGDGEIEIEIGARPAEITGRVVKGDDPVPGADVVLVPWPFDTHGSMSLARTLVQHLPADPDGAFRIGKLPPGEYRIFAVEAAQSAVAQMPREWARMLARAEKVKLGDGASVSLTLDVLDPGR